MPGKAVSAIGPTLLLLCVTACLPGPLTSWYQQGAIPAVRTTSPATHHQAWGTGPRRSHQPLPGELQRRPPPALSWPRSHSLGSSQDRGQNSVAGELESQEKDQFLLDSAGNAVPKPVQTPAGLAAAVAAGVGLLVVHWRRKRRAAAAPLEDDKWWILAGLGMEPS
eukprot:EG_transcript_35026